MLDQRATSLRACRGTRLIGLAVLVAIGLVALLPAEAQRSEKVYRVGILHPRPAEGIAWLEAFRRGLAELGYREGQNLILEYRWADREPGRFRELAGELVHLKVDLIFTSSTPGALAAKGATTTIPVVFVGVGDPVGAGVVASLAWPGSNITGITHIAVELTGKTLSLLKDMVPAVSRVAVLGSSVNPTTALKLRGLDAAARSLGVQLQMVDVRGVKDLEKAFSEITREKPDGLVALLDTLAYRKEIIGFSVKNHLPAVGEAREFVDAGGLMSYGANIPEIYHRAAGYVESCSKAASRGTCRLSSRRSLR
jgi:putative tryptophan/tyrosine transport system substrate-binding protein